MDYYEFDVTGPFALANPHLYDKNFAAPAYQLHVEGVEYITAKVTGVTKMGGGDSYVLTLDKSDDVVADALVVCTSFSHPLTKPSLGQSWKDRRAELETYRTAISNADTVLVAGGGTVGCEVAGTFRGMIKVRAGEKQSDDVAFFI